MFIRIARATLPLLLLFSLSNLAPANAAYYSGKPCLKVGSTISSGGLKYTCIKSGSKLVWNKGVAASTTTTKAVNSIAGKACSKLNSTLVSGGLKYTCSKSGTRLIWKSTVAVNSPTSTTTFAGRSCLRLGSTILYKGIRHICIKSGAKLIWDKGVKK